MKEILREKFGRDINKIFFVGIGGTSVSGLALIAKEQGFKVAGSDYTNSAYTDRVKEEGIEVKIGHSEDNVPDDTDLIVYSAAIKQDNPERTKGRKLGIPEIERSQYLGLLSRVFDTTIGIAGTHGKTTTSSMVAEILWQAGLDPSVSIGGRLDKIGGNSHLGKSDYFIVESCEFVDSFLQTQHKIGVITNIEKDHLDYFKGGIEQIKDSFHRFGEIIPEDGVMIACGDEKNVREVCEGLRCPVIYYGFNEDNDWTVQNVNFNEVGNASFDLYKDGKFFDTYSLLVPGNHNILDACASIIVGDYIGISKDDIREALGDFVGARRRFEFAGKVNDINVYHDYAHHPTELRVVIESAQNHEHNNLWVIFQPHTYSRTSTLFDEFVDAFEGADKVILNDIYSDRETNEEYDIYSEDLAKRIKQKFNKPTVVFSEFDTITKFLTDNLEPNDLVLIAGSQTIYNVAGKLVKKLIDIYGDENVELPDSK